MQEQPNIDFFRLRHLQSVSADSGCRYYNQKFLGQGGNGIAYLVTCRDGKHAGLQFVLKILYRISDKTRIDGFKQEIENLVVSLDSAGIMVGKNS